MGLRHSRRERRDHPDDVAADGACVGQDHPHPPDARRRRPELGLHRRHAAAEVPSAELPRGMNAPLKKLSELTGVAFDGVRSGYVPPRILKISKKLKLHKTAKKEIDPVTFEVVRHALWNVNEEHGATIQRLS